MRYLVSYDIEENRIRRQVQKLLETCARRLQKSVYIADLSRGECLELRSKLLACLTDASTPRLLIAPLCSACSARAFVLGAPLEARASCVVV